MGASETERGADEFDEGGGMTQDQIIQTLRKVVAENQNYTTWTVSTPHLVALVNAAIEEEREACAALCDDQGQGKIALQHYAALTYASATHDCATVIRARGQV